MKKTLFLFLVFTALIGCNDNGQKKSAAELKKEIIATEKAFETYCREHGIASGFHQFADSSAVIKLKNDSLLNGRTSIKAHFDKTIPKNATVTWNADFVDVSDDGTLAYTYGNYIWTVTDSLGKKQDFKGVFHTVWKRQKDGSWKYVWD